MPAKYGEASAKTSHDQPYAHMIIWSITANKEVDKRIDIKANKKDNIKVKLSRYKIVKKKLNN